MINLKILEKEVSCCSIKGKSQKRHFPDGLKRKICDAAKTHSINEVARALKIWPSSICTWSKKINSKMLDQQKKVSLGNAHNEQSFKEIFIQRNMGKSNGVRLTSPDGFCLEVDLSQSSDIVTIMEAFMGREQ